MSIEKKVSFYTTEQGDKPQVGEFSDFDMGYFQELEGEKGWIAIGQDNCRNPRYFTVTGVKGEKLGIVGVYDTAEDQNIIHTIVAPEFRGQGLARQFNERLMDKLRLPFITLTIDLENKPSLRAAEKSPGIKRVSDTKYEQEFHKAKFIYKKQKA
ncbi:MAG: hypothetical protein A2233_04750 [Candidatus Kerfeldbacteria bacterium RIFOXYA2_FULL_38_24]|uniref:N-acetyltransferase domain-containing protein n=1 Tax=Candidatus Kerfeldbacteria bacterium RIFOXYB2_FULL_38_14 TaxID=1798547 RepID=A0A1G2BFP8_9BACT|nr:MAG: hypothetical protein A2319_02330 [Candidatus Kerfeldbacteria bacterium RIFOXYB2_FULL_38_14]OGY88179.1 MAG: hypothetical protein A2233_04750 [Candidatus Kerfeldbacteria bacterium RIFOXYA2_FULL_38_24]OGY89199.1 MAG: hypothetical protein A2458_01225 [Candidatus Kerfeldbacteria bacterium RIFOXYC2_FULL_38_9]